MPYISLEEGFVDSNRIAPGRKIWQTVPTSGIPDRILLFLDAEFYIERVGAPAIVQQLQQEGKIPPVHCVFVSYLTTAERHVDFTCNAAYSSFLAEDVFSWIAQRHPGVGITLIGLSLSGLAAAFAARQYPLRFPQVLCQSPSFWWQEEWFWRTLEGNQSKGPDFWVCVGDAETTAGVSHPPSGLWQASSQIDSCRRTVADLERSGYTVAFREYSGGHDPACWRDDLSLTLPQMLSTPPII